MLTHTKRNFESVTSIAKDNVQFRKKSKIIVSFLYAVSNTMDIFSNLVRLIL